MACRMRRMPRRRSSSAAEYSPMWVSSGSSASASRRSTVSGVRSRCDRSATISRSLVREVISRSAIRLNAYPASASSRGPDGWMRTPRSPPPTAIAACTRLRAEETAPRASRSTTITEPMTRPSAMPSRIHQSRAVPSSSALSGTKTSTTAVLPSTGTGCSRTTPPSTSTTDRLGALGGVGDVAGRGPGCPRCCRRASTSGSPPAESIAASQAAAAGAGDQRAGHRGALLLGRGHGLVTMVGTQLPAERDEEREGGDGGGGGADIGQPRPQSGATNRNPTPRTVRR